MAAFNEALRARPLYAPLWAERARFHVTQGRMEQAAADAAQAALVCWNDPNLAALARGDAGFRDEALSEILQIPTVGCREGPEVWRGLSRRRASRGDWAGARSRSPPRRHQFRCCPHLTCWPKPACSVWMAITRVRDGSRAMSLVCRSQFPVLIEMTAPRYRTPTSRSASGSDCSMTRLSIRPISCTGLRNTSRRTKGRPCTFWERLSSAGRLDEAVRRFEESLAVQREWANSGMNAYGLALAHHRLGHPEEARRWLERAEAWLDRLDRTYAVEAPGILSGEPQVSVPLEFWVYAQLLQRARSYRADPRRELSNRPVRAMIPV